MLLAPALKPGDTIAVYSPSAHATVFAKERFERAKAYLMGKGYRILEGDLTGKHDYYRSGTIQERAAELNALIRNPEVRAIMSAIGGMNSNALLPYIDYEAIIGDPKIFIGYSDVTAILLGIYAKTGLVTYYGPAMVASFGEFAPLVDQTLEAFEDIVCGRASLPHTFRTPKAWTEEMIDWNQQTGPKSLKANALVTVVPGKCEGRLIGGNLNTLQGIWASPYMPEILPGDILFIEDSLKDIATVERSFAHLKLCGVLDRIGGLILGKHELFKDSGTGRRPHDVLLEVLGTPSFPMLAEFDCAHTHPMLTLPLGCQVVLDATEKTVTLVRPYIGPA